MSLPNYILVFIMLSSGHCAYALDIVPIFASHMVLQREVEIPVWGHGKPDSFVKVNIGAIERKTICKPDGSWQVVLPPFHSSKKALKLVVQSEGEQIVLENIAIGDVWLCAGQSNMAFQLYRSQQGKETINRPTELDIRHIKVKTIFSEGPASQLNTKLWQKNAPHTSGDFTAVGYYFAEQIAQKEHVSVGLVNIAVGGSAIETWMSEDLFPATWLKHYRDSIRRLKTAYAQKTIKKIGYEPERITIDEINNKPFQSPVWADQELPGRWEDKGYPFLDGEVYYVRDFFVDKKTKPAADLLLSLATIDDADSTWVNGHLVGSTHKWDEPRKYTFSSDIVREGSNRIIIKITDRRGSGGVRGKAEELYLQGVGAPIDLSGTWKFHIAQLAVNGPWKPRHLPALGYNGMLYPMLKFPVKGVLWYQGERNALTIAGAQRYGQQLKWLIQDWRNKTKRPDLPFLFVQLPGYNDTRAETQDTWSVLRQAQLQALTLPHTGCAITIDLGEEKDIHPIQKKEIGRRLALIALNRVYGDATQYYQSPELLSYKVQEDRLLLHFKHVANGLHLIKRADQDSGFALLEENGEARPVPVEITSTGTIKIQYERIADMVGVSYAWGNWPRRKALYNSAGLPAIPFRIIDLQSKAHQNE